MTYTEQDARCLLGTHLRRKSCGTVYQVSIANGISMFLGEPQVYLIAIAPNSRSGWKSLSTIAKKYTSAPPQ